MRSAERPCVKNETFLGEDEGQSLAHEDGTTDMVQNETRQKRPESVEVCRTSLSVRLQCACPEVAGRKTPGRNTD